jgi:hypothetical protein
LLVWFSLAFIKGYIQAILPLLDGWDVWGSDCFSFPHIAIYTWWDGPNHTWGPRHLMWFQVADFPTGEARIVHTWPSWYGLIPAIGIIVFAAFRLFSFCRQLRRRSA